MRFGTARRRPRGGVRSGGVEPDPALVDEVRAALSSPRIDAASGAEQESRDDPPVRPQRPRAAGRGRLHGADSRRRFDRRRDRSRRGRAGDDGARNSTDWDAAGGSRPRRHDFVGDSSLAPENDRPTSTRWRRCAGRTSSRPSRATRRSEPARTGGRDPARDRRGRGQRRRARGRRGRGGRPAVARRRAAAAIRCARRHARRGAPGGDQPRRRELDERRLRANRFAADAAAASAQTTGAHS